MKWKQFALRVVTALTDHDFYFLIPSMVVLALVGFFARIHPLYAIPIGLACVVVQHLILAPLRLCLIDRTPPDNDWTNNALRRQRGRRL